MRCIYVDVLIILNIYVNHFLLKATAKLTHTPISEKRCIFASVFGSLFSLTILIPRMSFILNVFIKLIAAVIIVCTAFGSRDKRRTVKAVFYFYVINFVFAGVILGLWYFFQPPFMAVNNSYFYIDFSLLSLAVFTAAAYFIVCGARYIMDKSTDFAGKFTVIIRQRDRTLRFEGLADTGNSLVDSFSGKAVIICGEALLKGILKSPRFNDSRNINYEEYLRENKDLKSLRLLPYTTINGSGIIPVFAPDEIYIMEELTRRIKPVDALIGINGGNNSAIFNPKLLI